MIKRFLLAIAVLALVFGSVIGFKLYKQAAVKEYLDNRGTPPVHLNAVEAKIATWDEQLAAIGSLRARAGIDIRSEVDGVITRVHVESGQSVESGDLLVKLDDTVDRATLKSARVRLDKAERDFERDQALFEKGLISEDQFEISRSEFESAEALVEQTRGIIDKKTIHAPFDGTVGIHSLAEGQYLEPGDPVVTLQALDTLFLDLHLPEKELERVKPGQRVLFTVPSQGPKEFEGVIRYVDIVVEAATRNVMVRAMVDNAETELLPGMFADATVVLDQSRDVVVVPRVAVAFSLYGETVYRLEKTGAASAVARRKSVTTGEVRGDLVAVEGLMPGEVIALDTQHRLLDGSPVVIENEESVAAGGVD